MGSLRDQAVAQLACESELRAVGIEEFLGMELPPRECILAPWLPSQGLAMVFAPRGVGKTYFALCAAYAVASGGEFLGWKAPKARGVLFLDGEMPAATMQERLASIVAASDLEPAAPLRIITPDLQHRDRPQLNLSTYEDQQALEPFLADSELVVVDNISTLCNTPRENEADGWAPIQAWALKLRAAGRSVLFVHHAGKGGDQRGTSRREDVLDTVISLRHGHDYTPDQGAAFEVHFLKSRGFYGDDAAPIEARLGTQPDGRLVWTTRPLEESTLEKFAKLHGEGLKQKDIADELGITKGYASKLARRAREEGLL